MTDHETRGIEDLAARLRDAGVAPGDSVCPAVMGVIGGRTPAEMNAVRTVQALRGLSGVAAVLLAALVLLTWIVSPVEPAGRIGIEEPSIASFEEQQLEDSATESTILTALFVNGMTP